MVLQVWEEVWQEGTPGSEGGIRLYLAEIMEVLPKVNITLQGTGTVLTYLLYEVFLVLQNHSN